MKSNILNLNGYNELDDWLEELEFYFLWKQFFTKFYLFCCRIPNYDNRPLLKTKKINIKRLKCYIMIHVYTNLLILCNITNIVAIILISCHYYYHMRMTQTIIILIASIKTVFLSKFVLYSVCFTKQWNCRQIRWINRMFGIQHVSYIYNTMFLPTELNSQE
jgi:hypothetical protein